VILFQAKLTSVAHAHSPIDFIQSVFHICFPYPRFNKDQDMYVWLAQLGIFAVKQEDKGYQIWSHHHVSWVLFPG